jgi:hypothetical protein
MTGSGKDDHKSKPSGRIRHDTGGRAVWEWAVESGRDAIDSTSRLLKKLNLSGLHLLDDHRLDDSRKPADKSATEEVVPALDERAADPHAGSRRGFNPYDSRMTARRDASGKQPQSHKPRITQPIRPVEPPGFFARLFGKGKR